MDAEGGYAPTGFSNLGALSTGPAPRSLAVVDLGRNPAPRFYTYREIDALADAMARGLLGQREHQRARAAGKAFARSNAGVVSAGNAARGHKQNRPAHPGTSCRRIGPTIGMPCCTLRARLFPPECHDQHIAISPKPRINRGYRSNAVIDPAVVDQG
jgi:hypothetical protein